MTRIREHPDLGLPAIASSGEAGGDLGIQEFSNFQNVYPFIDTLSF